MTASQARLREALNAGAPGQKDKGPPVADGILTVTPDTPEALEWRTRRSFMDSAGASSSYLEDDAGPSPSSLYGKFTWKIENFSEISKRELRSNVFEVGSYKWYILVYPQGCDVCNHLSLFLCVADYDKLLPGWSHFSQFTIAVVNKDPRKSKYSDTLHRFCKKEHDWGWKKFMELNKVLEGFTVSNTLVIKAQVQVIRDRPTMPFRCLDAQYRRELVRVYLTNVETICRKFVEERREALARLRDDSAGLRTFWGYLSPVRRQKLASERGEVLLKGLVKRFFNEKEVTSTLVMDALFSGCKQLEEMSRAADTRKGKKVRSGASMVVSIDKNTFCLVGDVLLLLERAATEAIQPTTDDKVADPLAARNAQEGDESKDYVERDERRLGELGRRTVEMYSMAHIFSELEAAYCEAESIKRQDALIKEEEEAGKREDARNVARAAAEREKKARKKERRKLKKEAEHEQVDRDDPALAEELELCAADSRAASQQQDAQQAPATASGARTVADAAAAAALRPASPSDELTRAIEGTARDRATGSTGRSPAGDEAGPSTSRADSLPSEIPHHPHADSDDGLSSTELTSSTTSVEDQPSTRHLRERADHLAAEVGSLRAALAQTQSESAAARGELASVHSDLRAARAELAARDADLARLREQLSRQPAADNGSPTASTPEPASPAGACTAAANGPVTNGSSGNQAAPDAGSNEHGSAAGSPDSSQDLLPRDSDAANHTSIQPSSSASQPLARSVSTSEPPPGFTRPSHQQQHATENGLAQSRSSGSLTSNGPVAAAPRKAWQGDPPESLGLAPRSGSSSRNTAGSAKEAEPLAQLLRDARSSSSPAAATISVRGPAPAEAQPLLKTPSSAPSMARSKSRGLNGNAAAFVPSSTASAPAHAQFYSNGGPPPPPPPGAPPVSQQQLNGSHLAGPKAVPSYRNAAAGVLGGGPGKQHAPMTAAMSQQSAATASPQRSMGDANGSTPPASPRAAQPRAASKRGTYSASNFAPATPAAPAASPGQGKRHEAPADSPGLDDFAHMGLITDLLD